MRLRASKTLECLTAGLERRSDVLLASKTASQGRENFE